MTTSVTNVATFLLHNKKADQPALLTPTGRHSYGELQSAISRMATHLLSLGCKKGDRVILLGENSFFWVVAYLGILSAGLVCVPIAAGISEEDLQTVLAITAALVVATPANLVAKISARLCGMHLITDRPLSPVDGCLSQSVLSNLRPEKRDDAVSKVEPDDLAALMFTSGSTGKPHGVMVSHRNIIANTESIIRYLRLTETDRVMTVLPFHYCFGASLLHTHLRVGGSLVLDSRFLYPEKVLQSMLDLRCTGFAGVPSHFQILLRKSSLRKKAFPHLRYVQQAGGQLAPAFIQELRQALPNVEIFIMYGQTEATARLSYLQPELLERKLGSVGKAIPGVKLRVVDEAGHSVRPGEIGEVTAEGENVSLGYWQQPEETASRFRNGVLHTGDLATVDEDGFIFIVDRAQDFLKCGGKRIGCRQIENQLQKFECLVEAAVVPMADDSLGEAVKAFVVSRMPDCPFLATCVYEFCRRNLAPQLVPRAVTSVPSLPKNNSGKVLKALLRQL